MKEELKFKIRKLFFLISILVVLWQILSMIRSYVTKQDIQKDVKKLFASSKDISSEIYTEDKIKNLPPPVQRYFKFAIPEDQPYISSVRLKHRGHFRLKPEQKWKAIEGQEYFTSPKPGFVWLGKLPFVSGKDSYIEGEGNLTIKLLSLIKIIDEKGEQLNQGELLRWLGESPWFPTALLPSDKLKWEPVDENRAKIILRDAGISVQGIFRFDKTGAITDFTAKRFKDGNLEKWTGHYKDYRKVSGFRIPHRVEVEWNFTSGDFPYARFFLTRIEYNKLTIFD